MSRLRGQSQNRENQESCPGDPGAAFLRRHFGAAKARPRLIGLLLVLITIGKEQRLGAVHSSAVIHACTRRATGVIVQ